LRDRDGNPLEGPEKTRTITNGDAEDSQRTELEIKVSHDIREHLLQSKD
jgi:hypothetical protein